MGRFDYQCYSFSTAKEMELAKKEAESIEYVKSKIDFKDREKLRKLYDSFLEKGTYITPIGISFLKEIYEELSVYSAQPVPAVPVYVPGKSSQAATGKLTQDFLDGAQKKSAAKKEAVQVKLRNVRIINVFLILLIIAMFAVVCFGKNSPFQDAEDRILDKYSSWEQQLQQREEAITAKEQELGLEQ